MKTSNLILLALAVLFVLFIAAIPFTFHWKLTHGDHTVVNPEDHFGYNQYSFTKIRSIVLSNIHCVILPSDSLKIDVETEQASLLALTQKNDTLVISLIQPSPSPRIRLHLPTLEKIIATNSKILLRGQLKPANRKSYIFNISNTTLSTANVSDEERISQFIDSVYITGSNSFIDLSGTLQIKKMAITDIDNVTRNRRVSIEETVFVYNHKSQVKSSGKGGIIQIEAKE